MTLEQLQEVAASKGVGIKAIEDGRYKLWSWPYGIETTCADLKDAASTLYWLHPSLKLDDL